MYRNILRVAEQNAIIVWQLYVATEVEQYLNALDIKLNDDDFDIICDFVYDWVINSDDNTNPYTVMEYLGAELFYEQSITIEDIQSDYCKVKKIINSKF